MNNNKKELMKELNQATEDTNESLITFKSLAFIILKTLELKEKGLTSEDFMERKLNLEGEK
jgi:hypothetical protein